MAQARTQQSALGATAQAVGDTAQGTVSFVGSVFNGIKTTVGYGISLLNADGGVGAALGLAAGTAAAFFALPAAAVAGTATFLGLSGASLIGASCAAGVCLGGLAGGHAGRSRVAKERVFGKQVREPSMLNKQALMGFGIGAAGLAAVVGTVGVTGLLGATALIAGAALPVAGAYLGGTMGAKRMMKDYTTAVNAGVDVKSQNASVAQQRTQEAHHTHPAHRSYKNSVSAEEWAETSSLMRDSASRGGEGGHAAKILADRAAAQELMQQQHAEA